MRTDIIATTAALAASASAFNCNGHYFSFFNRKGAALSYDRLDPALFPGTLSPHLHSFDGGNGLSANTDFAATQASTCSTNRVKTDKSLYWRPTLFFKNNEGYTRVPEQYTKIYYKYGETGAWDEVDEFPEKFNMIAGQPLKRSAGNNQAGVRWACHSGQGDPIFSEGFPKGFTSCKYGFASEITFPSCWNGNNLDPKDPHAHMAYPTGGPGTAGCPSTHNKARFPKIFIEFWYDVSSFKFEANEIPWVLSNGDPTGYGFHADFLNGWQKGVLKRATSKTVEEGACKCGCGCGQAEMESCFGTENTNKDDSKEFQECSVKDAVSAKAPTVLKELPGCNPIQAGPASATSVTGEGCAATPAPGAPSAAPSAKPSSKADTYSSVAVKGDAVSKPSMGSAPTPAVSQQYGDAKPASSNAATPKSGLPSLSLIQTGAPPKSSGSPAGGNGECQAPVYVTVTPTLYVTAGSNTTSCDLGTVTKTVTEIATVTAPAQGGMGYMSN